MQFNLKTTCEITKQGEIKDRVGYSALFAQESAKRLAALGGSEKKLIRISRRKSIKE